MEEKNWRKGWINWTNGGIALYLAGYGVFSAGFLTRFPFVHSDESWLAGLSRDMLTAGSLSVTESFFDARKRYPHAIKSLFHLLQIGFIQIFGYSIESVRLLSLVSSLLLLALFYFLMTKVTGRDKLSIGITILFSLDAEFIYASHFARQEILLGVFLTAGLLILLKGSPGIKESIAAGLITGISIGFHPNSFLLACSMGCILLFFSTARWKTVCSYVGVTGLFAGGFVLVSYSFDSHFLLHYFQNGAKEFGIDASFMEKTGELRGFFQRLFQKESGTYYVTELRFSLLLFFSLFIFMAIYAFVMKEKRVGAVLSGAAGLICGMVIIGRYNQTSIFFLFPFGYLLFGIFLTQLEKPGRYFIFIVVLAAVSGISMTEVRPWIEKEGYTVYLKEIEEFVPADARVVANLNTGFYFHQNCLRDYRNLPYTLEDEGLEDYMEENKIEYILYSMELDYLYERRPYFNVIYGDIRFVPELREFCRKHGEIIGQFISPVYGSRVISIMGQKGYSQVIIYKVRET